MSMQNICNHVNHLHEPTSFPIAMKTKEGSKRQYNRMPHYVPLSLYYLPFQENTFLPILDTLHNFLVLSRIFYKGRDI